MNRITSRRLMLAVAAVLLAGTDAIETLLTEGLKPAENAYNT